MGDLIVKKQYFVCENADQIEDELLVMVAGGGAGGEQPLDVQQQDLEMCIRDRYPDRWSRLQCR